MAVSWSQRTASVPTDIKEKQDAYALSLFTGEGVEEAERQLAEVINKTPGWKFVTRDENNYGYIQHISWLNPDPTEGDSLGFAYSVHYREMCIEMFKSGELFKALRLYEEAKEIMVDKNE